MPQDLTNEHLTLVQVMAWRQAITWTDVNQVLYHHRASLDHNELMIVSDAPSNYSHIIVFTVACVKNA